MIKPDELARSFYLVTPASAKAEAGMTVQGVFTHLESPSKPR